MNIFIALVMLIVGFIILIKGADVFVDGASGIARNFKVSKMLIGLTIVAFGTSAPEFAVSVKSLASANGDMLLGNVIGSNILNILLILGVSLMFKKLTVKNETVEKELPVLILTTLAFAVLILDRVLGGASMDFSRQDGIVLTLFFCIFIYYLIKMAKNKVEEDDDEPKMKLTKAAGLTALGLVGIVFGSNFAVDGASQLALAFGVSQRMIALTIVALGTSLPELVTSIMATRKGESDIAIGNVVGSNIFNIGIVAGLPVAIFGTIPNVAFSYLDIAVMIASAIMLYVFSKKKHTLSKVHGYVFLTLFVIYYGYVILS